MQGCFPVLLRGPGKIHNHSTFITVAIEWIIEASCAFPTCIQVSCCYCYSHGLPDGTYEYLMESLIRPYASGGEKHGLGT
ncbi:uncharacterized protein [Spinacia oleracea]|uniref:Uncharacterized protein isoform X2 n=1 Tax=Spinacia oleracea TaxID=3562 RepID=A0ABM3RR03_SPIOL|nr:uncharacterized protein LOC110787320 isoform X2 [Spinacia oleracea]